MWFYEIAEIVANELRNACTVHGEGQWKTANERIGFCLPIADAIIKASGKWPSDKWFISAKDRISLLEEISRGKP